MTHKHKISNSLFSLSRLHLLLFSLFLLESIASHAQTRFTRTTFNSAYTPITIGGGATSSTATGDNANQTGIPLGFSFGYADSTFTLVGLSTNGLVWFDVIAPATTAGHANIIAASAPNQTLSAWCANMIDDASSDILYQTQGSVGSRTFTVQYTNYPTFTGVPGSNVRMNCQVILYETTNIIEFKYGTLNIIGGQTTSGGAMIGMEWGAGGNGNFIDAVTGSSIVSHKMLSPLSGWPSYNFRFTPGIPTTILSGTYNVGVGQTYNSLTQAVADVNHRGISGSVTLNLTDAQYDTTAANGSNIFPIFVATPNGSATNLLTISKTGTPATLAYRGSSIAASGAGWGTGVGTTAIGHGSEPLLGVCASYTTVSNLNLITHGTPQTVEIGLAQFELFGNKGAQNNFYDKISVDLDRSHGDTYGISSFSTTSPGGFAGTNSYNTFRDLNIKDCNFGIAISGPNNATGPADQGNQIITSSCTSFNYIGDPNVPNDISSTSTVYGIFATGQFNFTISNCIIQNISTTSSSSTVTGIVIANSFGTNEISNNIIRTLKRNNAAASSLSVVAGISISYDNQVMTYKIFNNSISNLLTSYTGAAIATRLVKGIYFSDTGPGTVTGEIWNNSISIDGSTFPNASTTCLEFADDDKTMLVKNNVFANFTSAQSGLATHYCFVTPTIDRYGNISSLSNYNNFYIANTTNGHIGRGTTTDYSTLAAWQTGMSFNIGTDANSVSANPFFNNNNNNLHGTASSASLDGAGTTPPAYITADYDCETRTAPHDIGFDNFTTAVFTYYEDNDGDTYGNALGSITSSSPVPPSGYVTDNTDCNDGNSSINPGATEITCNGIDENCNGMADDGNASVPAPTGDATQSFCAASNPAVSGLTAVGSNIQWYATASGGSPLPSSTPLIDNTHYYASQTTSCESILRLDVLALVNSAPPSVNVPFPTVPAYACNGDNLPASSSPVTYATTYTWDGPAGTTFNSSGNPYSGSNTVTVNYGSPNGSGYNICVQAGNSCGTTTRRCSFVRGTVNVPGSITPANNRTTECASTSASYSIAAIGGATGYTWTITGNATVIGSGTTVTVNFGATWSGGNLCVTANTPCYSSAQRCLALSNITAAPGTISGSTTGCPGSSGTYSIPVASGAATYNWVLPANTSGSSASNSILVNFLPGFIQGDIKISITSICGTVSAQRTKTVASGLPSTPTSISGNSSGLCNQTSVFSCPVVTGASSYTWTVPGTINSGQGSTSINTSFGSIANSTVCVVANNSCGSGPQRCLPVTGKPNINGNINYLPATICANQSGVDFQVNPVFGATVYNWSFPSGVMVVNDLGNEQIVNWGSTGGTVSATAANACGNSTRNTTISLSCREIQAENSSATNSVSVYPNPAHNRITIRFNSSEKTDYILNLIDLSGRIILTDQAIAQKGINTSEINIEPIAKGIYIIELKSDLLNTQTRIVAE